MKRKKVFIAMSGGVDSSVAAALLKKQGNLDVVGIYMKCWGEGEYCTSERDAEDARLVAEKLNIPFYVFDFTREYREKVFEYMVREYAAGRTPNPDVFCNSEIKFGIFLEKCLALGADFIATGHYAKKVNVALLSAKDKSKDQSYFLWRLNQEQLKRVLFPIGDYLKSEVREMAREFGLPTAKKKDSQGLCFVGNVSFDDFLRECIAKNPGPIMTTSGRKIGEHDGLSFYTIGQRRGIGIGGGMPYYVAAKEPQTNTLIVAEGNKDEELFKKEIETSGINWIGGESPELPFECEARIRYRQPLQHCRVELGSETSELRVVFDEPQRAATPGQSVVFYVNESPSSLSALRRLRSSAPSAHSGRRSHELRLLGGGIIVK